MTTITEAAKLLGVSRQRIHQLLDELHIQPQQVPRPFGGRHDFVYVLTAEEIEAMKRKVKKVVFSS